MITGAADRVWLILVPILVGIGLALPPAIRERSWRVLLFGIVEAVFGILLPVFTFVASGLLMPEWKGACRFGWFDCFHVGKFALAPLVLWAVAAFYTLEIWHPQNPNQPWIVQGFFLGSIVSIVSLVHGAITLIIDWTPMLWGLLIPLYTAVWYTFRTAHLIRTSEFASSTFRRALVGSLPFWGLSVALSWWEYVRLPDVPPACFVVSAASRGHAAVVGPFVVVRHRGQDRRANRQLITFWQFEALWSTVSPNTHRRFRRAYNVWGPRAARRLCTPWMADMAYLLLKPVEIIARMLVWWSRRHVMSKEHEEA